MLRSAGRLACLLLLVSAIGCAHDRERPRTTEPTPPTAEEERDRTRRCMTLAEALYGASYPREVIARSSGSPRMNADDDALAPLLACLHRARLDDERWPDALVRSLANAHGAAVWASRMPSDERLMRLEDTRLRADVTHYWRARVEGPSSDEHERLLRLSLEANPSSAPARLALALALVRAERPEEGDALLEGLSAEVRPDAQAYVRAAALLSRGERHQAAALLEGVLDGKHASTSPDGPDALALRTETLPDPKPLLCAVGRAHAAASERSAAVSAYRTAACFEELTALYLDEGDAFSALLASFHASPEAHVRAIEAAGADGLLRERLEGQVRRCEALLGGERCDEHRARLQALVSRGDAKRRSPAGASDDEVLRRALGIVLHDDETALLARQPDASPEAALEPAVEVIDVVADPRGERVLVQALQPSAPRPGLPDAVRASPVLVTRTAQGWRAVRFTREMALSLGGP